MLVIRPFFCTLIQLVFYLFTQSTHLLLHLHGILNQEERIGKILQNFPKL
jgi:hypothetical protein